MIRNHIFAILLIICFALQAKASYEPAIALQMAYMSAVSYESILSIEAWNCQYCSKYKINLPKPFFNLTSGIRGFTGYSAPLNAIIVSFKGVDNVNTWILDLKTAKDIYDQCPGCEVSRSFNQLYLSVKYTMMNQVESLHKIYRNSKIYVTGHGLGGALAILSAVDIQQIYQFADAIYTFGQPRVGNIQFAAFYTKNFPDTYRIINNADVVPHLPVSQAGFFHSSYEEWYQNQMTTYKTCEGDQSGCSNSLPVNTLNTNDNAITAYLTLKVGQIQPIDIEHLTRN